VGGSGEEGGTHFGDEGQAGDDPHDVSLVACLDHAPHARPALDHHVRQAAHVPGLAVQGTRTGGRGCRGSRPPRGRNTSKSTIRTSSSPSSSSSSSSCAPQAATIGGGEGEGGERAGGGGLSLCLLLVVGSLLESASGNATTVEQAILTSMSSDETPDAASSASPRASQPRHVVAR